MYGLNIFLSHVQQRSNNCTNAIYIMLLCAHAYILALPLGQYPLGILPERWQAQQHGKSSNEITVNINALPWAGLGGAAQASKATLRTLAHWYAAPGHYLQLASGRASREHALNSAVRSLASLRLHSLGDWRRKSGQPP
jgi:hypothetical protein